MKIIKTILNQNFHYEKYAKETKSETFSLFK